MTPVGVQLVDDERAVHGPERPVDRLVDRLDRDFFEHDVGRVLRPVHVTDLGLSGHDHGGRPVAACEPGAFGRGHVAVGVVEHVLAEVPDRAVVGLRVPVERDLRDVTV